MLDRRRTAHLDAHPRRHVATAHGHLPGVSSGASKNRTCGLILIRDREDAGRTRQLVYQAVCVSRRKLQEARVAHLIAHLALVPGETPANHPEENGVTTTNRRRRERLPRAHTHRIDDGVGGRRAHDAHPTDGSHTLTPSIFSGCEATRTATRSACAVLRPARPRRCVAGMPRRHFGEAISSSRRSTGPGEPTRHLGPAVRMLGTERDQRSAYGAWRMPSERPR